MSHSQNSAPRQTISSLEIARLVQARHDSVKRTIKRLAQQKVIQFPPMVEIKNNQSLSARKQSKTYQFTGEQGKIDSIVVVAQLCPAFTARIVARWQELENALANPQHLHALRVEALKKPLWQAIYRYQKMGLKNTEIARLTALNPSTIRRNLRRMEACGLILAPKNLSQQQNQLLLNLFGGEK